MGNLCGCKDTPSDDIDYKVSEKVVNVEEDEIILKFQNNNPEFMEISEIHKSLKEKYIDIKEDIKDDNSDNAEKLIRFGGFYCIAGNISTNMVQGPYLLIKVDVIVNHLRSNNPLQYIAHITLCLDGKRNKAVLIPFNGTFDNNILTMDNKGYNINLTFKHEDKQPNGIITSFNGTINGQVVKGNTLNNATPYNVFAGTYLHQTTNKKILEISDGFKIKYDNNSGNLENVPFFIYNVTYSFVTLFFDLQAVELVLGTGCENGVVATEVALDIDIFSKEFGIHKPLLQSITKSGVTDKSVSKQNTNSKILVPFCGYYRFDTAPGVSPGSFISFQTYEYYAGDEIHYKVYIAISTDGTKSTKYLFDTTMSFDGTNLIIPNKLNIDLKEKYVEHGTYGKLVEISGVIIDNGNNTPITGCTYLHPIKMAQWIGNYYQSKQTNATLIIMNESSKIKIIFKARVHDQDIDITTYHFMYIPIMYFGVIKPKTKNEYGGLQSIWLEFGINACGIVMNYNEPKKNKMFLLNPYISK